MTTIYLISDTHFGHANILNFKRSDGSPVRLKMGEPFDDVNDMNEFMISRWNAVVRQQDHVYHLGDFAVKSSGLDVVKRLNGHKRLVRGNHDIFKTKQYIQAGFEEIYGVRVFNDKDMRLVLSHVPLHPDSVRRWGYNVHGHLHNSLPQFGVGSNYFNVSVEMIDYTPITLEEVKLRLKEHKG